MRDEPRPAGGLRRHAAGPLDDARMVRPDGCDDRIAVAQCARLQRHPAFVGGEPADQVGPLLAQLLPQRAPVEIEADGEADAADLGVEDARRVAGRDAAVDLAFGRVPLGITADQPAAAVDQCRDVGDASFLQRVESGDHVHRVPPRALRDGCKAGTGERLGDLAQPRRRQPGGGEPFRQAGQVGLLPSRRLKDREAEPHRLGRVGLVHIDRRNTVLHDRKRRGGDANPVQHGGSFLTVHSRAAAWAPAKLRASASTTTTPISTAARTAICT